MRKPTLAALSAAAFMVLAVSTASPALAAPEGIYVPAGIASEYGILGSAGTDAAISALWPLYQTGIYPLVKPIMQSIIDFGGSAFIALNNAIAALPEGVQNVVPGILK